VRVDVPDLPHSCPTPLRQRALYPGSGAAPCGPTFLSAALLRNSGQVRPLRSARRLNLAVRRVSPELGIPSYGSGRVVRRGRSADASPTPDIGCCLPRLSANGEIRESGWLLGRGSSTSGSTHTVALRKIPKVPDIAGGLQGVDAAIATMEIVMKKAFKIALLLMVCGLSVFATSASAGPGEAFGTRTAWNQTPSPN
jgi:hypothetical protein